MEPDPFGGAKPSTATDGSIEMKKERANTLAKSLRSFDEGLSDDTGREKRPNKKTVKKRRTK